MVQSKKGLKLEKCTNTKQQTGKTKGRAKNQRLSEGVAKEAVVNSRGQGKEDKKCGHKPGRKRRQGKGEHHKSHSQGQEGQ